MGDCLNLESGRTGIANHMPDPEPGSSLRDRPRHRVPPVTNTGPTVCSERWAGEHGQPQAAEIGVEREARDVVEQLGNQHVRERIADGESLVTTQSPERTQRGFADMVSMLDDPERGHDRVQERDGEPVAAPNPEQRHGFNEYFPGGQKGHAVLGAEGQEQTGILVVSVAGIEAGIEERRVAEDLRRNGSHRVRLDGGA